jgi:hypothetical protein
VTAAVRIAAGQGFWGDWLEAPYRQVTGGPIDYLMMDYLAEVTMSILQKQKSRDPGRGYAKDFVPLMERLLPLIAQRRIKVTSNAGGVNPRACAEAVAATARTLGLGGKLTIGIVTGDELLGRLDDLLAHGQALSNLDTDRPLSDVRDRVLSANAYLGAGPVVEALRRGADIVITGRVIVSPRAPSRGTSSSAARRRAAATVSSIGSGSRTSPTSATRSWRPAPTARSR